MNRPRVNWITVFGLGHMWPASGTWGSLPPVLLAGAFFFVARVVGAEHAPLVRGLYVLALLIVLVAFCYACVAQGDGAEARFGEKDPSQAVADETAGQCLPLLVLPVWYPEWSDALLALLTAFVAFRVMDIVKPPPARGLQRLYAGWGVLIDDLVAGVYAAVVTWVVVRLWM
ncbi:MAG TPA: phosphatidylglycerophosphatase A [Phycisphaerales bacterium]|nr:phosphatidylglycerophosphatase A [Phycisphaerales bacterium]